MTDGADGNTEHASRAQGGTASGVKGGSQAGQVEAQSAVKRRSLYERLTHDLRHDHKVNQEVRLGKRVGFYKLRGQLGTGNFAKVKLGIHLLTTEKVAVKIIDKTKLDEHARRLLSREITCMEWLDHPNIVRLYEVMETFSMLHLVMECAGEGDLQARVTKEGPMNEDQARHIFAQVTAAIHHMHKKSVIHRDLKAENVFFISDSQIKVGDFGFSTHSRGNMLDTFCGSPPYAAPELFADNCYQGELVDIWAMGVMLYYILSGIMPFRGETIPQLKAKILEGKYDMPEFLTPVCQDLIAGLLIKEPEERFVMEDVFSSMWLRTGSTAMELNPSKKSLPSKTNSRSKLPILSRDHGVVDSSGTGNGSSSALDASFNSDTESIPDSEVLQSMERLGVPIEDDNLLIGEPRNPIAGTYRILLHRKHLLKLSEQQEQQQEHSAPEAQERKKKLSACSIGGGQPLASDSHRPGSGGSMHKQKSSKRKKDKKQDTSGKPMSKICVIL